MGHPDVDALIGHVYDAALSDEGWPRLLDRFMHTFGGAAAVLYERDDFARGGPFEIGSMIGYTERQAEMFTRHFRHLDMRARSAIEANPGKVYVDDRDLSFAEIARSPLHNDFYRPSGVGHISGVLLERQPGRLSIMSLHRATEHGAFPAEEVAALDRLAPHLVRAWMLRRHFTHATAVAAGALLALDHFVMPVFLVDANLRLSTLNVAADALLRAEGPLKVRGGQLHVMPPANDDALCRSVRDALTGGLPPIMHLDKTGHSRITLFVAADRRAQLGKGGLALILANDHASTHQIVTDMLVRQFGLTVAEARTAAALTEGYAPLEIGAKFGISIETVRTQLRQAMLKCDARGLVQLTTRVMASLAALRRP